MGAGSMDCFKAYDVRGKVPEQLDEALAYRIGRAYADLIGGRRVAVGRDARLSGPALAGALSRGLNDAGVDVIDIGICGTEEVYFATFHLELDGGIMVTASHNPAQYNGMKFVRRDAVPVGWDTGLKAMAERLSRGAYPRAGGRGAAGSAGGRGTIEAGDITAAYVNHLLGYIDVEQLKPFRVACNPGNGCAGPTVRHLATRLPTELVLLHEEPDGTFPNGVPNPLLPENRAATADLVRATRADFGVAWDGDADRCFFFDEQGEFLEGYYVVGLLAEAALKKYPGAAIVHDPRLVWNTVEVVERLGGRPVACRSGHTFIKERMRLEDAAYGGEMSAHHYFRDFHYCDSGMIPWLLMAEVLSNAERPLSQLMAERIARYPISGEINREVSDPDAALTRIEEAYGQAALAVDRVDGLSLEFDQWRFNVRKSNTEPLLRLNVEARSDRSLVAAKCEELLRLIQGPA